MCLCVKKRFKPVSANDNRGSAKIDFLLRASFLNRPLFVRAETVSGQKDGTFIVFPILHDAKYIAMREMGA